MKLNLAGERDRGTAMGINEFAGYSAVGLVTFLAPWIAAHYGLRPYPFYTGVVFSAAGLLVSALWVRDLRSAPPADETGAPTETSATAPARGLGILIQGGAVNNGNDGMLWGLFPLLLSAKGYGLAQVGAITAIYPVCWGIGQLFTGKLGDHFPKMRLIAGGLALQCATLFLLPFANVRAAFIGLSVALGLGKALVYPNFAAAIAERVSPAQRSRSIGLFRFWRDLGYAIGAALTGILADAFNIRTAILMVAAITGLSALLVRLGIQRERRVILPKQPPSVS
jgi:MFS family permease